jgi:hypothetical protein
MSSCASLPQELVNEIIDGLSDNPSLEACSLVSKSWAYPARDRLFHRIRVRPEEVEGWLSRPPESVRRMAPHIVKFELPDRRANASIEPSFRWDDSKGLLTRVISSLLSSPVQWLRIESFDTGGFSETTLDQCFEPICHSLRSLELKNPAASTDATRYLISLFPNLDDLYIGNLLPTSLQATHGWGECGIKYSPRLSGTFEFFDLGVHLSEPEIFAGIVSLSPRFHAIFIKNLDWNVQGLMEACAETVETVTVVWYKYIGMVCDLCGQPFTLLTIFVIDDAPPDLFSPCKELRNIMFAIWTNYRGTRVREMLSSITSKHLSAISLEIAHPDWCLWGTPEQFYQWWEDLEKVLCQLADRCMANGVLAVGIFWWRRAGHRGDCGTTCLDRILPRFRKKGSIRFMESDRSNCERCAEILGEASGGA